MPTAATISLSETLALLDEEFADFANGVAQARYAFWLGSGISFSCFPGLKQIVVKTLEFLRSRVDPVHEACPFYAGLKRAFDIANLNDAERASIDLSVPVKDWPVVGLLRDRLSGQYATFLNIDIDGERLDLLVWDAVDVAGTYADPNVSPDAEHYAIAALVMEGLVTELPSANWDGLIEKAIGEIAGEASVLKVCVRSEDLQAANQMATLIKFHGCAIRAKDDENTYRPYLVAAQRQIDGWHTNQKTKGLAQYLTSVAITKPTLMLGFSAQDANIRKVFDLATDTQNWVWPGELPAYVMAEDSIGEAQTALLGNVYRDQFDGANRAAIKASAHLRAFAKPLLPALLLWALAAKLRRLARLGSFDLSDEMAIWVDNGIKSLRDQIAATDDGDHLEFVRSLVFGFSRSKRIFLSGKNENDATRYEPLTSVPINKMNQDLESETNGSPEGALIAAVLAQGVEVGDWSLQSPQAPDTKHGTLKITKGTRTDRVFVLGRPEAELALFDSEAIREEDEDVVLIHARPIHERLPRSPSRAPGRTARSPGPRRLSVASLIATGGTPRELMDQFKLEVNL